MPNGTRTPVRSNDLIILCGTATLMVALIVVTFMLAPPPSTRDRASTFSSRYDGAKAAFVLLKELGYNVERSYEPISTLQVDPESTVLVLASPTRGPSQLDQRAIQQFLDAGGIVLATGDGARFLPRMKSVESLRFETPPPKTYDAVRTSNDVASGTPPPAAEALTRGAPAVRLATEVAAPPDAPAYETLYRSDREPGVLIARIGRGHAIWWAGSTPVLNGDVAHPGHLELLLNVLGPEGARVVLWDEYYHGHGRGFVSYLAATPLPAAMAQTALMAFLAVFTFSRRRGPIHAFVEEPRASSMEFVEAMGALYAKARAAAGAVETGRARLRRLLIGATQMPSSAGDDQLAKAAAVRYAIDEQDLRELLASSAAAAETATLAPARALALSRRLQEIAAMLQRQ